MTYSGVPMVGKVDVPISGTADQPGGFANVWYDISTGSNWIPFIGGGIGFVRVDQGDLDYNSNTLFRTIVAARAGQQFAQNLPVAPINPICRRNPSIPGLCRIASPTCARPFELSLPWSVRLSSAARRCILRTLPCDSSLPP